MKSIQHNLIKSVKAILCKIKKTYEVVRNLKPLLNLKIKTKKTTTNCLNSLRSRNEIIKSIAKKTITFSNIITGKLRNIYSKIKKIANKNVKLLLLFLVQKTKESLKRLYNVMSLLKELMKSTTKALAAIFRKYIFKGLETLTKVVPLLKFLIKSAFLSALSIKRKFFSYSRIKALNKKIANIFIFLFIRIGAFLKCRAFSLIMLCTKIKKSLKGICKNTVLSISSIKQSILATLPSKGQFKRAANKLKQHGLLLLGVVSCGILSALMLSINHKKHEPVLAQGEFQQDDDLGILAIESAEIAISTVLGFTSESPSILSDVAMSSSEATEPEPVETEEVSASAPIDNDPISLITSNLATINPIMQEELIADRETPSLLQEDSTTDQSVNVQYKEETPGFNSSVQLGGNYTYLNLKPEGSPSFGGSLGGMQGSYEYKSNKGFYTGAKFDWKEGVTSDSSGDRSILYFDTQERFGYTLSFNKSACKLTLYSGLGYRHLWQEVSPNSGASLQFRYNEFYMPVGLSSEYSFNSWASIGLGFSWMPQVFSTVGISAIKGTCWNLTNTLANLNIEVPFDFALTKDKKFHIIAKPFYQYWEDGHTTSTTASGIPLGLPGNTYNYWGLDLNFSYNF